jgi:hypothetical protein
MALDLSLYFKAPQSTQETKLKRFRAARLAKFHLPQSSPYKNVAIKRLPLIRGIEAKHSAVQMAVQMAVQLAVQLAAQLAVQRSSR